MLSSKSFINKNKYLLFNHISRKDNSKQFGKAFKYLVTIKIFGLDELQLMMI